MNAMIDFMLIIIDNTVVCEVKPNSIADIMKITVNVFYAMNHAQIALMVNHINALNAKMATNKSSPQYGRTYCSLCRSNCKNCEDQNTCTICNEGRYLNENKR